MNKLALLILRISLGITFLWIGLLIYRDPIGWGSLVQPWVLKFVPNLQQTMIETAFLDMAIGILLITGLWTWLAALVGALHLVTVLLATGVNSITVRDIGLLGAAIAITLSSLPDWILKRLS